MAVGSLTRPRVGPRWARIALVYAAARIVTTTMLWFAAALSGPDSRHGADATVLDLMMGWDAQWYWLVAVDGYPAELPRDEAGLVQNNQWAFMPLYPLIVRTLAVTPGAYPFVAISISLVAGYLACLVLHALLQHLGESAAMWAVALFAAGPLSALFQMGYAEALFLLWLFLALRALRTRRLAWLYLLVPLMGYTRPGVLAFSLLLALYGLWRWSRRARDPLPVREIVHIVATGLLAAAVGFSWQVIAGVVTGDMQSYLDTELSWRRGWLGGHDAGFVPFDGFVQAAGMWFTLWGLPAWAGVVALVLGVVALAAVLLFEPRVRALGVELRLWSAAYLVYLLAVFFPQSSLFRLLLPLAPLYGALAAPPSRAWRASMLVLGLVSQWWWIYGMLALGNTFFLIP